MIYYFSGTGNSRWAAERLARLTDDQAADLAPLVRSGTAAVPVGPDGRIGLVFPIHAWGPPSIVLRFVRGASIPDGAYAYAVCTCGDDAGRAMQRLKRSFPFAAAWSVAMPNNYLPAFDADNPALAGAKIAAARERLAQIAEAVAGRKSAFDVREGNAALAKTALINPLFRAFVMRTRPFSVDETCTGCGLCQTICPVGAIRLENGRPVWIRKRCTQCMGCINRCPVHAIQYGDGTRNKGRYSFPETD